jgi:hypothetical protein
MASLLQLLTGGERRSLGKVNEVIGKVLAAPRLFATLFGGMQSTDVLIRVRSADAVEKLTRHHPEWLRPYKRQLVGALANSEQKEVRWHVAQMLPRLDWSERELPQVVQLLRGYLADDSSIVKSCAMQALAELLPQAPALRQEIEQQLRELSTTGTPAMRARGRKLLARLAKRQSPFPIFYRGH